MKTKPKGVDIYPAHKDRLGQMIYIGDYVTFPQNNHLQLGIVKKLNNKMVGISRLVKSKRSHGWSRDHTNKYPEDCVVVDGARVTMITLQQDR